jgi:hypothetical protein
MVMSKHQCTADKARGLEKEWTRVNDVQGTEILTRYLLGRICLERKEMHVRRLARE